jgi:hypothetical protein
MLTWKYRYWLDIEVEAEEAGEAIGKAREELYRRLGNTLPTLTQGEMFILKSVFDSGFV